MFAFQCAVHIITWLIYTWMCHLANSAAKGGARAPLPALTLGQFSFEPPEGTVQPGGRVEIAVVFKADGNTSYTEALGVQIDQRDFADCPLGIPYEVAGESCIPGEPALWEQEILGAMSTEGVSFPMDGFLAEGDPCVIAGKLSPSGSPSPVGVAVSCCSVRTRDTSSKEVLPKVPTQRIC